MKRIISAENYLQLQELTTAGNYRLQLGFALAGLTYKIENGNVKFYLKDDYFYKNVVWSADLPLNINGTYYDEETIGKGMKNLFDPSQAEVSSVNGKKGDVVLTAGDVNAYTKAETDGLIANEATARQNADNEIKQSVNEINSNIEELKSDISFVDKRITNVVAAINDHNTSIENIEENIEGITQSIQEIENDIDAVDTDNTANKADIAELKSDVSSLKERVGKLETDAATHLIVSNIKAGTNIEVSASGNDVTISATGLASNEEMAALEEKVTANTANIVKEVSDRTDADNSILTVLSSKANVTDLLQYINGVSYDSATKHINFNNGGTVIAYVDATDFIKDGMVDSVAIDNGNLVVTFNTDAGKEPISIDITEIFNPDNYYTKYEVDGALAYKADSSDLAMVATSGSYNDLKDKPTIPVVPTNVSAFTNDAGYLTEHQSLNDYYTKSEIDNALEAKQDAGDALTDIRNISSTQISGIKGSVPSTTITFKTINNVGLVGNDNISVVETSELNNYYTKSEVDQKIAEVDLTVQLDNYYTKGETDSKLNEKQNISDAFSGDYNDLTNKPVIPTVPTNVSEFTNDAGYLTKDEFNPKETAVAEALDELKETKADKSELSTHINNADVHFGDGQKEKYDRFEGQYYVDDEWKIMPMAAFNDFANDYSTAMGQFDQRITANENNIATKANKSDLSTVATSGSYNDLKDKPSIPTVPTNVSAFNNDAGYLTEHQSLNDYYKKSETYSKTEINQAIADVDVSDQLQNYYTKEESDNKFAVKFTDVDDIVLVNELPSEPKERTLYLIPVQ